MLKLSNEEKKILRVSRDTPIMQTVLKVVHSMVDDLSDIRNIKKEDISEAYVIGRKIAADTIEEQLLKFIENMDSPIDMETENTEETEFDTQ